MICIKRKLQKVFVYLFSFVLIISAVSVSCYADSDDVSTVSITYSDLFINGDSSLTTLENKAYKGMYIYEPLDGSFTLFSLLDPIEVSVPSSAIGKVHLFLCVNTKNAIIDTQLRCLDCNSVLDNWKFESAERLSIDVDVDSIHSHNGHDLIFEPYSVEYTEEKSAFRHFGLELYAQKPDLTRMLIGFIFSPVGVFGNYTITNSNLSDCQIVLIDDYRIDSFLSGYSLDTSNIELECYMNQDCFDYQIIPLIKDDVSTPSENYNEGIFNFFADLPSGETVPLGEVSPPENYIGNYAFRYSDVMYSFVLSDWQIESLNGYELDSSVFDINSLFIITDDDVQEIHIPYRVIDSSSRVLKFVLRDQDNNIVKTITQRVPSSQLTCNTPIYNEFDTFPFYVDVDTSLPIDQIQEFSCYLVDLLGYQKDSFDRGYSEGFNFGQASAPDVGQSWQEGYDEGLKDGLSQNKLTAEQIQHYTKDYNAITGFFEGMYNWMKNMFFDLGDGIQYKGVKAIDIVSSVVVIAVVIWAYKTIF